VAGDDGAGPAFGGSEGCRALVEAEAALAAGFVRAVAFEAVVRKDGADVAGEVRGWLGSSGGGDGEAEESGERQVHGREWRNARRVPVLTASREVGLRWHGEIRVPGLSGQAGSEGPCEVGTGGMDWGGYDFRNFVWVELEDAVSEGGGGTGWAFADCEDFLGRMDAIFPMVDRGDAWDDLDAGG